MLYVFLIIFVLSLPIAVPAFIVALIIHFVNKRHREKNGYMYRNIPPQQMMNVPMEPLYSTGNMQESGFGICQEAAQPVMPMQPNFAGGAARKPEKIKPQREPMSSSTVMLLIGTALVVLSGIAFGAANWLSTSPFGRVSIIFIASLVSFAISAVFMKAVKLKGTSSAFFMVGSLLIPVAILIASFYDMLGNWLSFDGGGRYLLFAVSFFLTSAGCFAGHKIYRSKHFVYSGLSMLSAGLLFTALQASLIDNAASMEIFASVLMVFQAFITALIFIIGIHKKISFAEPVKIIGSVTAAVYGTIGLGYAIATLAAPVFGTFFILALVIAQLVYYGISKNQKWMLGTQTVFSVMLAFVTVEKLVLADSIGNDIAPLIFIVLSAVIFFINRFIPKLRNVFSSATAIFAMSCGCIAALNFLETGNRPLIILASVLISALICVYMLNRDKAVQIAAGIVSPMLPTIIAVYLRDLLRNTYEMESATGDHLVFGVTSLIFIAISAALIFLPNYAFNFHANHPRQTDVGIYTNMGAALLLLIPYLDFSSLIFIPLAALILHFVTANMMKNNVMAIGSGVISCAYLIALLEEWEAISENALLAIIFACFLMLMSVSKIVYGSAVITKKEGRVLFDTALLSGWILIPFMADRGRGSNFFLLISLAVFTACFVKKNTKDDAASILLSVASVIAALALFERPFLLPESEMVYNKITIAIIAMVGIAFRVIWRNHERGAKIASNLVFIFAFAALMIDALYFEDPGNTVFVLAVTTAVLIVSFMTKSKTWFSVSSIALVTIVLYASKGFLASLSGWVYLFAAGLILIGIAAINEYYKQKGENVKSRLATVFSDWSW